MQKEVFDVGHPLVDRPTQLFYIWIFICWVDGGDPSAHAEFSFSETREQNPLFEMLRPFGVVWPIPQLRSYPPQGERRRALGPTQPRWKIAPQNLFLKTVASGRQGPLFSIRMDIGIFCSDTVFVQLNQYSQILSRQCRLVTVSPTITITINFLSINLFPSWNSWTSAHLLSGQRVQVVVYQQRNAHTSFLKDCVLICDNTNIFNDRYWIQQ